MADHKNCKRYDDCQWREIVGYCPEECNRFKHKDEVVVVRCKDCVFAKGEGNGCWCTFWGIDPDWDHFCSVGERRTDV